MRGLKNMIEFANKRLKECNSFYFFNIDERQDKKNITICRKQGSLFESIVLCSYDKKCLKTLSDNVHIELKKHIK